MGKNEKTMKLEFSIKKIRFTYSPVSKHFRLWAIINTTEEYITHTAADPKIVKLGYGWSYYNLKRLL